MRGRRVVVLGGGLGLFASSFCWLIEWDALLFDLVWNGMVWVDLMGLLVFKALGMSSRPGASFQEYAMW